MFHSWHHTNMKVLYIVSDLYIRILVVQPNEYTQK